MEETLEQEIEKFVAQICLMLAEMGMSDVEIADLLMHADEMLTGCGCYSAYQNASITMNGFTDLITKLAMEQRKRKNGEIKAHFNSDGRWN